MSPSLALLTDLYQLTMAYGYWKKGLADRDAVFHLFFRKKPFQGEFAIAAGLETALTFLKNFHYSEGDLAYLEQLKDAKGGRLFEPAFLDYLASLKLSCSIDAVPEGTPLFPYEPLLRVQGPLLQAQLLESPLLNLINFPTLIATKAARICYAAQGDPVVEFGLRRAQGIDGALSASRAAFIGGCTSTSNLLAGERFGIPVMGTHSHSWILSFDDEEDSFEAFADVLPHQSLFLVDTYDSIEGAKRAIRVGKKLRKRGVEMAGVRLDSGDLAALSIQIRTLLDEAGFPHAKIMASNELDETLIRDLKHQGAKIDLWGVGTHLVTGKEQPALDGVYKLSAIKDPKGQWHYKLKLSEQLLKVTNPGIHQIRRYFTKEGNIGDLLYDIQSPPSKEAKGIDPLNPTQTRTFSPSLSYEDLLVPVMKEGHLVYTSPPLTEIRKRTAQQLSCFPGPTLRFLNPQPYFVGLEERLYDLKFELIQRLKEAAGA